MTRLPADIFTLWDTTAGSQLCLSRIIISQFNLLLRCQETRQFIKEQFCEIIPARRCQTDSDPQHARTSSSPGLPRSLELAHSPVLPRLNGTDCRYTFVPSSRLTVLKSRWSLCSSPLTAPNCRDTVWFLCDRSSAIALMRAFVMTSVVLRRVRNRLHIIITPRALRS